MHKARFLSDLAAHLVKHRGVMERAVKTASSLVKNVGLPAEREQDLIKLVAKERARTTGLLNQAIRVPPEEFRPMREFIKQYDITGEQPSGGINFVVDPKWQAEVGAKVGWLPGMERDTILTGYYDPKMSQYDMMIDILSAPPNTIWHELAHKGQYLPEAISKKDMRNLAKLTGFYNAINIQRVAKDLVSPMNLYAKMPSEVHARAVARAMMRDKRKELWKTRLEKSRLLVDYFKRNFPEFAEGAGID